MLLVRKGHKSLLPTARLLVLQAGLPSWAERDTTVLVTAWGPRDHAGDQAKNFPVRLRNSLTHSVPLPAESGLSDLRLG